MRASGRVAQIQRLLPRLDDPAVGTYRTDSTQRTQGSQSASKQRNPWRTMRPHLCVGSSCRGPTLLPSFRSSRAEEHWDLDLILENWGPDHRQQKGNQVTQFRAFGHGLLGRQRLQAPPRHHPRESPCGLIFRSSPAGAPSSRLLSADGLFFVRPAHLSLKRHDGPVFRNLRTCHPASDALVLTGASVDVTT